MYMQWPHQHFKQTFEEYTIIHLALNVFLTSRQRFHYSKHCKIIIPCFSVNSLQMICCFTYSKDWSKKNRGGGGWAKPEMGWVREGVSKES